MKKFFFFAVLVAIAILSLKVLAVPAPKVFVCKYIGIPNVDERLQTGQNPISVSQNAIANFQGVGSSFNDAQGRSLVIAFDTGQDEPNCPVPQNTPPPPTTPPTTTVANEGNLTTTNVTPVTPPPSNSGK